MTKDVFQILKRCSADFVQINFSNVHSSKVLFEQQKLKDFSKVFSSHVSASVWIGKKHGVAVANVFSEKLLKKAIKIAKASEDLEFFYGLPQPKKALPIKGLYDGEKTEEEILNSAESMIIDLKKKETMPEAVLEYSTFDHRVVNSLGVDLTEKESLFNVSAECLIKDKTPVSHTDSYSSRKIPPNSEINCFSARVLEETRELRNPLRLTKIPETVILEQRALSQLLDSAFLSNLNGLNVLKKRSIFADKLGEKLFSEDFSLKDSGILEGGIESRSFDGEGVPCQENSLIEKGVLKKFIYDYNTAKHLHKNSTGNSTGRGIGFNNILISKGRGIEEDGALVIKDVIGAHTCNEITTSFSVKSLGALLIDKGERKPIKDVMINGKMVEILNNITGVGKDIRNVGNIYLPKIAFKGIRVNNL